MLKYKSIPRLPTFGMYQLFANPMGFFLNVVGLVIANEKFTSTPANRIGNANISTWAVCPWNIMGQRIYCPITEALHWILRLKCSAINLGETEYKMFIPPQSFSGHIFRKLHLDPNRSYTFHLKPTVIACVAAVRKLAAFPIPIAYQAVDRRFPQACFIQR